MRAGDDPSPPQPEPDPSDLGRVAIDLALAISRLRSRLREEAGMHRTGLSLSQVGLLGRLIAEGPATAAYLATAEHVSQQAIAQSLITLKSEGLVASERDPSDGRKSLLSATETGHALYRQMHESRETWLRRAIEAAVTEEEVQILVQATALFERLAAAGRPRPAVSAPLRGSVSFVAEGDRS